MRYRVPAPAVRDGIAYITEDRKIEGFFETMSIARNIFVGQLASGLAGSPKTLRAAGARIAGRRSEGVGCDDCAGKIDRGTSF